MAIRELPEPASIESVLARVPTGGPGAALWWLGQAGFLLQAEGHSLLIDPYLSDFLARKYAGKVYPHVRAMPSPLAPERARGIDMVLCTHRHSDHMDPETLPVIASLNPTCLFVMPRAARGRALEIGLPADRLAGMVDGERITPMEGISVEAVHSAHEERRQNDQGEDEFLGYVIRAGGVALYHSGDCVPHPDLRERLAALRIDAALLPINGRDEQRRANGVPGNFTFQEAVELCRAAGIPSLLCHHFGMFDFNTADPAEARVQLSAMGTDVDVHFAATGLRFSVDR